MANMDLRKTQVFLIQTGFPAPDDTRAGLLGLYMIIKCQRHKLTYLSFSPASLHVLLIGSSELPAEMLFSAERWGTLMDLVCYRGRRGLLQPLRPSHLSVCTWAPGVTIFFPPSAIFHPQCCEMELRGKTQHPLKNVWCIYLSIPLVSTQMMFMCY